MTHHQYTTGTMLTDIQKDSLRNIISYLDIREVFVMNYIGNKKLSHLMKCDGVVERLCFESPMAITPEALSKCMQGRLPTFFELFTGVKHLQWLLSAPCGGKLPIILLQKFLHSLRSLVIDENMDLLSSIFSILVEDCTAPYLQSFEFAIREKHPVKTQNLISFPFPAMPSLDNNLTRLSIIGNMNIVYDLANLPKNLEEFIGWGCIVGINTHSSNNPEIKVLFPRTLRSLSFWFSDFDRELYNTSSIGSTQCILRTNLKVLFESLPEGMLNLKVTGFYSYKDSTTITGLLPRMLQTLHVGLTTNGKIDCPEWLQMADLPPTLRSLMSTIQPIDDGHITLPQTLTVIQFGTPFKMSKWPNFTFPKTGMLRIGNINIDEFEPTEDFANSFISELVEHSAYCIDQVPKRCTSLSLHSFSAVHIPKLRLLPSCLKRLSIDSATTGSFPNIGVTWTFAEAIFTKLPRNLTALNFQGGAEVMIPSSIDLSYCLPNLTSLTIIYTSNDGHHPKFCPRNLPPALETIFLMRIQVEIRSLMKLLPETISSCRITGAILISEPSKSMEVNNIGSRSRIGWRMCISSCSKKNMVMQHNPEDASDNTSLMRQIGEMISDTSAHLRCITMDHKIGLLFRRDFYKRRMLLLSPQGN